MAFILHKNAILTGYVDFYCLVCDSCLTAEDDIPVHIGKSSHKQNLDTTNYFEKYKNEYIRKVKKGYYCEYCNVLLTTAAVVRLHVAELEHNDNKKNQFLRKLKNDIVAFNNILIDKKSWNGLIDDSCTICDTDFEDEHDHIAEPSHVLGLIQNKVEKHDDKNIYRKANGNNFHCLTCNMFFISIDAHFSDTEHERLYKECQKAYLSQCSNPESNSGSKDHKPIANNSDIKIQTQVNKDEIKHEEEPIVNATNIKTQAQGEKIRDQIPIANSSINIQVEELENTGATKKQPEKVLKQENVSKEKATTEKSTKNIPEKKKVTVEDIDSDICRVLGAKNYVTKDDEGKQWCILCDWYMDNKAIDMHVNGLHHQTILKMHKERMEKIKETESKPKLDNDDINKEKNTKTDESKEKILDSVPEFQENYVNIDFVSSTAYCKKCSENLAFEYYAINNHIKDHKQKPNKNEIKPKAFPSGISKDTKADGKSAKTSLFTSPVLINKTEEKPINDKALSVSATPIRETDEEVEKFAKENQLTFNCQNSVAYCRICEAKVPSSIRSMKEHVAGALHKSKTTKQTGENVSKPPDVVKQATSDFAKNMIAVQNPFRKDIVINDKFCINNLSFHMITKQDFRLRCHICETTIDDCDRHISEYSHENYFRDTTILISFDSEFIREVRSGSFHCGFCNHIQGTWEDLENHLKSTYHKESKTSANWRLQEFLPQIAEHRRHREIEERLPLINLMRMMSGNPFF